MNLRSALLMKAGPTRVGAVMFIAALEKRFVDEDVHAAAATSPANATAQPTEAQASAGNYRKGHVRLQGMRIAVENPAGSRRRPEWPAMIAHYGYIKQTKGADGDHVDCFLKPATDAAWSGDVYVIDQHIDGKFSDYLEP